MPENAIAANSKLIAEYRPNVINENIASRRMTIKLASDAKYPTLPGFLTKVRLKFLPL